ncbi:MAG: transposase family protein [Treponema sp.]|jgi:hypothetical protein|nr:transposase family protein [Treponema sp.]
MFIPSESIRQWGYIRHKLIDLVVIGRCSIITSGEGFDEMEELGRDWEEWFRQFLELPHGDTFRRLFERLNPGELMTCRRTWLGEMSEAGGRRVSTDGKGLSGGAGKRETIRRSMW